MTGLAIAFNPCNKCDKKMCDMCELAMRRRGCLLEPASPEDLQRSEETIDQKIKRVVAEELAAFTLPDGKRPRDVRLVVSYDQMDAYISLKIPGEEEEA